MAGYVEKGIIRLHKKIAKDIWQMQIELPLTAREAKPGQFIHMKVNDPRYLLRRPISIAGADPEKGLVEIISERRGCRRQLRASWYILFHG